MSKNENSFVTDPIKRDDLPKAFLEVKKSMCMVVNRGVGVGTGFIVADYPDGYIIASAAHVLREENGHYVDNVLLAFSDWRVEGTKITVSEKLDIALIMLSDKNKRKRRLPLHPFSASIGVDIAVVGFPYLTKDESRQEVTISSYPSLVKGIISSIVPKEFNDGIECYQLDVMLLNGFSGGPVFSYVKGEPNVVGIAVSNLRPDIPVRMVGESESENDITIKAPSNLSWAISIKYVTDYLSDQLKFKEVKKTK